MTAAQYRDLLESAYDGAIPKELLDRLAALQDEERKNAAVTGLVVALTKIADGNGVYGSQAMEYKTIARNALAAFNRAAGAATKPKS